MRETVGALGGTGSTVSSTHPVVAHAGKFQAKTLAAHIPKRAWQRLSAGAGAGLDHVARHKLIRRGVHTSVKALEDVIKAWIHTWNTNPRPFAWTKTADEILKSLADYLAKINQANTPTEQ
jgi:hypothetical protein